MDIIEQETVKIENYEKFLQHVKLSILGDNNEPLKLAIDTMQILEKQKSDLQSLPILIGNGCCNIIKFIGSGRTSFICEGLVLALNYSNISLLSTEDIEVRIG